MKTIYITGNDNELLNFLPEIIKKFSELSLVGNEPLSEDAIRNCGLYQPDFIISDYFNENDAKDILSGCPNSYIVIINEDLNRSNALISALNQENYYNIINLDKTTSPNELCQMLIDFNSKAEIADSEKIKKDTISLAELDKAMNENQSIEAPKNTSKEDVKTVDTKPLENEVKQAIQEERPITLESENRINQELNLSNFKSKSIAVYSKKGGTGKSTISKELANIFSSVKLPKKLSNGSQTLKTIVVDMDFERGSLRSYLGVDNPMPNIYVWINDILTKIEDGVPIEKIYYSSIQIMQNYTILLNNCYRVLLTDQGDLPTRTLSRIFALDQNGDLLTKIIQLIHRCLRKTFDIVIYDLGSDFNEISKTILEESDDIIYPMLPTFADIENFKSFNDDIKNYEKINPYRIKIIMNQYSKKINFINEFDDVLKYVKFQTLDNETNRLTETPYNCLLKIPYDLNIVNINNNIRGTFFVTTNGSTFEKQIFLKLASLILPIFKVKNNINQLKAKDKLQKQKQLQKEKKENTLNVSKSLEEFKPENENKENVENSENSTKITGFKEYITGDLSKETYENFINNLKKYKEVKCLKTGFPCCDVTPKKINKEAWKKYQKQYKIEIKNAIKNKNHKK